MKRYNYNPEKRQLIFLNAKGNPVFSLAGPIAEKAYNRIVKVQNTKQIQVS